MLPEHLQENLLQNHLTLILTHAFCCKKKTHTNKNVCRVRTCFIDNWKNNCAKNEVITELHIYLSKQHIKNSTKKIIKWMVRAKLCCDFGNAIQNYNKTKILTLFIDKQKQA